MAYPDASLNTLSRPIKQAIAKSVVGLFNDRTSGERPVPRRPDGLFGPASVTWRVHGDVAAMMIGGVAGLMLQMLHPAVLAGVWDHSRFRDDMHGRLRRTARFIAQTTYGSREEALSAMVRVRGIHAQVGGTLPDGTPYSAGDPALLAWVHVTEATSFLAAWVRYAEPRMSVADRDRYMAEMAQVGEGLGADPVPRDQAGARRFIEAMRPALRADDRTRHVARLVLTQRAGQVPAPVHHLMVRAATDLLPDWARRLHALPAPGLDRPLVQAGARNIAHALRWAFN